VDHNKKKKEKTPGKKIYSKKTLPTVVDNTSIIQLSGKIRRRKPNPFQRLETSVFQSGLKKVERERKGTETKPLTEEQKEN